MRKFNSIGQAVRFVRLAQGLGQEQLAKRVDLSDTYISMIENGNRSPTVETLQRLCTGMGISLTLLFMLTEKDDPFVRPLAPLAYSELAKMHQESDHEQAG